MLLQGRAELIMSTADFKKALNYVTQGPKANLSDKQRLNLYALYKQVTVGPCKEPAPSRLKFVARAKHDAWKKLGKMPKDKAIERYIKLIESFAPRWRSWKKSKL